jgi:hypothetical protein
VNKKILYFVVTIISASALLLVYYRYNPAKYRIFPKCPFHYFTGFDCPGCGSQRALYSLLHGNIFQAVNYNLLMVISLPVLLIHFYFKAKSVFTRKDVRWNLIYHPLTPRIIFVIVVLFWILRNIPVFPFNYLSADHIGMAGDVTVVF